MKQWQEQKQAQHAEQLQAGVITECVDVYALRAGGIIWGEESQILVNVVMK